MGGELKSHSDPRPEAVQIALGLPLQSYRAESRAMKKRLSRFLPPLAILGTTLFVIYIALFHPTYITNTDYLGGLIILQVLLAAVWKYEQRFFPLLLIVFLWAGMAVPMSAVWTSGRWPVLAVGALAGFALYMHSQRRAFGTFHLLAFCCVLAAFASAGVSSLPVVSSLKALSLLLLFLYGSTGARLALAGREEKFFRRLLLFLGILVYLSAAAYFVLRLPFYGNPNSMGAIMGVIAVPLLFWRVLITEGKTGHRKAVFVFVVSVGLLFFSQARAGILAAAVACCLTCASLRRYRLLIRGTLACMAVAVFAIILTPSEELKNMPSLGKESSLSSIFLYKGHPESGLLLSRVTQWDQAVSAIGEHPWLGNGYGTTKARKRDDMAFGTYSSSSNTTRERGDSYLAIMEGVGLLGVLPFFALVLLLVSNVGSVFTRLRRTSNPRHCSVPVAMVLVAGLVHAGFEDWLFAVGYYLCVFFWVLAFAFLDLPPPPSSKRAAFRPITDFSFRTVPQNVSAGVPQR